MISTQAYPLAWPDGWPRARGRKAASYRVRLVRARDDLVRELRLMGAKSIVISSNAPPRADNTPAAGAPQQPQGDPGVAVYFYRGGQQQVIASDRWTRLTDNLRACGLTVAALRMIERTGASELLDRAFLGFKALPPVGGTVRNEVERPGWWHVLGCGPRETTKGVRDRYKRLARENHPDHGGDLGAMAMINRAYEQFQEERGLT